MIIYVVQLKTFRMHTVIFVSFPVNAEVFTDRHMPLMSALPDYRTQTLRSWSSETRKAVFTSSEMGEH